MSDNSNIVYISLGSNQGNRQENLQLAIFMIGFCLGKIQRISPVYRTVSWGFDAPDFFNACIQVCTDKPCEQILSTLLSVEQTVGRVRSFQSEAYQSRVIDLDILLLNNEVHNTKGLVIPHPYLHERNFVLAPLSDIAPELIHPIFNKTISELAESSSDRLSVEKTDRQLHFPPDRLSHYNYIAIEGNIGSGKTTLSTTISNHYHAKLILERYADNPFLPKFYADQERYGFALEMSFLAERYSQVKDDFRQLDLFKRFTISDYNVFKSLIFAAVTLNSEEFQLYRKLFYIMYENAPKPDLYVYLYQNTDRLLKNIEKRGRSYEKSIKASYLEAINKGYLDFIQSNPQMNTLILDVSNRDFVENIQDYYYILSRIMLKSLQDTTT